MKKILILFLLLVNIHSVSAQNGSKWTLNTRGYTTNYWTTIIYASVREIALTAIHNEKDSILVDRIVPDAMLVFPIGISNNEGFLPGIRGPYDRAFSSPFKHLGDWSVGLDASYNPNNIGLYAGCYIKSQEVVFKGDGENMRGYYLQPRAGFQLGVSNLIFEIGAFYDCVMGFQSDLQGYELSKNAILGGWGLDFSIGERSSSAKGVHYSLQFSLPLHDFFNKDYKTSSLSEPLFNSSRKVAYLMVTARKEL